MAEYYPPVGFHFRVVFALDRLTDHDFRFQEVSGLTRELAVETVVEGGENRFAHRLPGRAKYSNLVLKRGLVTDSRLIEWFKDAIDSLVIKTTVVRVSLLNEDHVPLTSWDFVKAWPVKWSVSTFNAQNNSIAVDTVELAYQYFTRLDL